MMGLFWLLDPAVALRGFCSWFLMSLTVLGASLYNCIFTASVRKSDTA